MNVLVAPDSLKGSLTAVDAAEIITLTARSTWPDAKVRSFLVSDGGENALDLFETVGIAHREMVKTMDPLGRLMSAPYVHFKDSSKAWIELSQASGLVSLRRDERKIGRTNTFGTGVLIRHAIRQGCDSIYIGLGGSASNDGGTGLLAALGFKFLDFKGNKVMPIGNHLHLIDRIVEPEVMEFQNLRIRAACDVRNPLHGPNGAAYVYGPQKGATQEEVEFLDNGLKQWGRVLEEYCGKSIVDVPGSGAAGGVAAGLMAVLGAELVSGFDLVAELSNLDKHLHWADLVLTAEGSLDDQSLQGKATVELAKRANSLGVPVVAFAGTVAGDPNEFTRAGITKAVQIRPDYMDVHESMREAMPLLESAVVRTLKEWKY